MEYFDIVDHSNRVIGTATRKDCHGNPELIHRAVHVLVLDLQGRILIQKRSKRKDIQPGKWDTSVGGHVNSGESYEYAARRETREELGIEPGRLLFLYEYLHSNAIESEFVQTWLAVHCGPFQHCPEEIDELQFLDSSGLQETDSAGFTPNFIDELKRFESWKRNNSSQYRLLCDQGFFHVRK